MTNLLQPMGEYGNDEFEVVFTHRRTIPLTERQAELGCCLKPVIRELSRRWDMSDEEEIAVCQVVKNMDDVTRSWIWKGHINSGTPLDGAVFAQWEPTRMAIDVYDVKWAESG